MDESQKNAAKKAMLLQQQGKIKAVTGIDADGNPTTVDPTAQNLNTLLNVSTWDTALENFYKKMLEQIENPSHTGVWAGVEKVFVMTDKALGQLIKIDLDMEILDKYQVDPQSELAQGRITFQPMDIEKIDRVDLARKGIDFEDIEPYLKACSYGNKSSGLIEMKPEMPDGTRIPTKGRIYFEEQPDGSIKVIPQYKQERLNLDAPVCGQQLPDHIKENLAKTGHGGHVVDLEYIPGKVEPCYVSVDKYTNTVEVMPQSHYNFRTNIKGVELTEGQLMDFVAGKKITLEKTTTRAGYYKDAHIQVDAADRNFSFTYDGLDKNRYAEENRQIAREKKNAERLEQGEDVGSGDGKLSINKFYKGQRVPDKYIQQWEAANNDPSLRPNIEPCYLKGLKNDAKGEPYKAWIIPRWDLAQYKSYQWKPTPNQIQKWGSTPANESKTQVAVNSEGKTNEVTKGVDKPLKQGQQQPTEAQKQQQQRRAPAKNKGKSIS